jgi:hypothetical protein
MILKHSKKKKVSLKKKSDALIRKSQRTEINTSNSKRRRSNFLARLLIWNPRSNSLPKTMRLLRRT